MKSRVLKIDVVYIYGISTAIASMIVILITLVFSVFKDYEITVYTNLYGECYIEIILIAVGLVCFIVATLKKPIRPRA